MIKLVGLLDYDAVVQKKYLGPNYDLGVTYAILKQDPNINVRLVVSTEESNLQKYDRLLIFKLSSYLPHPSGMIKNYYSYQMEEYGPGFVNKPSRPNERETFFSKPDFTCYNPILKLSIEYPNHKLAWDYHKACKVRNPQHLRLFEKIEGEYLRKDINLPAPFIVLHDDPNIIFTHPNQLKIVEDLMNSGHKIFFVQPLDISSVTDTNILERVITDSKYATLRRNLMIREMNDSALWFVNYYMEHKCKRTDITVLYEKGKTQNYYLCSMLLLNYYNNKTNYSLRLRPYWDKDMFLMSRLTHSMYRFLYEKPFLMSFYEYVFYLGCAELGVPKRYVRTNDMSYDFILQHYGMPKIVEELETWLEHNPEYEEQIFIGGSSKYEECRRKYYDTRGSKKAFGRSSSDISKERSSQ